MYGFLALSGVVLLALITILRVIENQKDDATPYRYTPKDYINTRSEADLFRKLEKSFGNKYYIFPQVHLSSLLNEKIKGQNWARAFRHINGKSVDFVLVDKKTLKTICAIECDDYTHDREDRIKRDKEVNKIFKSAGIPLVRLRASLKKTSSDIEKTVKMSIDI